MKLKLIQPKMNLRPMDTLLKTHMSPPLGIYTIANIVNEFCQVDVINENIEEINFNDKCDLVGISVTVDTFPRAIEIYKQYKKRGITVVLGGIHITVNYEKYIDEFECLCIGFAEDTWPNIIQDFKLSQLKEIYISNLKCGEKLSSPAYKLIKEKQYLYTNIISTSRGCPFKCSFCYNSSNKIPYVNREIFKVIEEIKSLKTNHILFIDDNFIGNPIWTELFLKELLKLKIKWSAAVTVNLLENLQLLDLIKESGCKSLFIGFETLNDLNMKNVNKNHNNINKYENLIKEIHNRDIMINASLVFGLDNDSKDVFDKTLQWVIKNKIETVTSHILTPYPGTKIYNQLIEENRIIEKDYSKYNTANVVFIPKQISVADLYNGYIKFYKDVYSTKNILKRLPNSKKQWIPFLLFNFLYRKHGKKTEFLCKIIGFNIIGKLSKFLSYK